MSSSLLYSIASYDYTAIKGAYPLKVVIARNKKEFKCRPSSQIEKNAVSNVGGKVALEARKSELMFQSHVFYQLICVLVFFQL